MLIWRAQAALPVNGCREGLCPFAGSRDSVPCGVWGNAPTVIRQTYSKGEVKQSRGSEASRAQTLRFLRSAPQAALFNVCAVSRRWRDRTACLSDMAACFRKQGFRACGRESGALRSPPDTPSQRSPMRLDFYRNISLRICRCNHALPQWICGCLKKGAGKAKWN